MSSGQKTKGPEGKGTMKTAYIRLSTVLARNWSTPKSVSPTPIAYVWIANGIDCLAGMSLTPPVIPQPAKAVTA